MCLCGQQTGEQSPKTFLGYRIVLRTRLDRAEAFDTVIYCPDARAKPYAQRRRDCENGIEDNKTRS